ncbi:hypothetical protein HP550_00920 [Cellulomonas humilata]|uniref:PKD domain-containing protein n=1 Tax=Cellulomonas humilata TaxID=144055 RepID=A0A7Y5ZZH6_9CELL|nr:hypothetical protein [Cellulomonas humilata]NUU15812.1 hypothetical protein [Cellulomonas humilata]
MLTALVGLAILGTSVGGMPGGVTCAPNTTFCVIEVQNPGQPGTPTDPGGVGSSVRHCTVSSTGREVPCQGPLGWFNDGDDCYWRKLEHQPAETDVIWGGRYPEGAIYAVSCAATHPGGTDGWVWAPTEPPGYGSTAVSPAQLAQEAVAHLGLTGPAIRMTIEGDEMGLVGVPLWLWTEVGPTTWGPNSATASVPGLSVTATAQARQIVWDMGDGRTETCKNAGTPYYTGGVTSPTCQHIYEQSSAGQAHEAFPVTATTTWDVTWTGGGASGALTVTRQSTASVRIGEMQVLITQE